MNQDIVDIERDSDSNTALTSRTSVFAVYFNQLTDRVTGAQIFIISGERRAYNCARAVQKPTDIT
jgi:hypothetical protein